MKKGSASWGQRKTKVMNRPVFVQNEKQMYVLSGYLINFGFGFGFTPLATLKGHLRGVLLRTCLLEQSRADRDTTLDEGTTLHIGCSIIPCLTGSHIPFLKVLLY